MEKPSIEEFKKLSQKVFSEEEMTPFNSNNGINIIGDFKPLDSVDRVALTDIDFGGNDADFVPFDPSPLKNDNPFGINQQQIQDNPFAPKSHVNDNPFTMNPALISSPANPNDNPFAKPNLDDMLNQLPTVKLPEKKIVDESFEPLPPVPTIDPFDDLTNKKSQVDSFEAFPVSNNSEQFQAFPGNNETHSEEFEAFPSSKTNSEKFEAFPVEEKDKLAVFDDVVHNQPNIDVFGLPQESNSNFSLSNPFGNSPPKQFIDPFGEPSVNAVNEISTTNIPSRPQRPQRPSRPNNVEISQPKVNEIIEQTIPQRPQRPSRPNNVETSSPEIPPIQNPIDATMSKPTPIVAEIPQPVAPLSPPVVVPPPPTIPSPPVVAPSPPTIPPPPVVPKIPPKSTPAVPPPPPPPPLPSQTSIRTPPPPPPQFPQKTIPPPPPPQRPPFGRGAPPPPPPPKPRY